MIKNEPELSFITPVKSYMDALNRIQVLSKSIDCLDSDRQTLMFTTGNKAYLVGITPDSFALSLLPDAHVNREGIISFSPDILTGLIKGRDEIEITGSKGELRITATKGKYSATLEVIEHDGVAVFRINDAMEKTKAQHLDSKVIQAIRTGVKRAEIVNYYSDEAILAYITVTEKAVSVTCSDNYHITQYVKKLASKRTLKLAVSVRMFGVIDRFIGTEENVKFSSNSRHVRVEGEGFIISIPATQVEEAMFDMVPAYLKNLGDPLVTFTTNQDIAKITDNVTSIMTEDNKLTMTVGKKSCKLEMRSRSGSVSDEVATSSGKGKMEVMLDPRIFTALIRKVESDDIAFELFEGIRGGSGCFRIRYVSKDKERMTLVGTFYTG